MSIELSNYRPFSHRHNGPTNDEIGQMLEEIRVKNLQQLIAETVPSDIRLDQRLNLPQAQSEHDFLRMFSGLMKKNKVFKSYIGLGYYNCYLPPVIQRNILENPGWYTAYTPYQA
jgi:glycine dehydrogenase